MHLIFRVSILAIQHIWADLRHVVRRGLLIWLLLYFVFFFYSPFILIIYLFYWKGLSGPITRWGLFDVCCQTGFYLAQNLWFRTGIIFIRVYVSVRVCVCVSVCLWVFISTISKSSWPIATTLGKMIYNNNRQVAFEDELNRPIRTEVRDH